MKSCCTILTLLVAFCECSQAFVVVSPGQARARLRTGESRRHARAAAALSCDATRGGWRTAGEGTSRRRRSRGGREGNEAATGGVRGLSAGLNMPGLDLLEYLGEESVRHHYPSAFIGGTVGVLGTLSAIQLKINEVKELTACPYCRSSGQLPCATCYGVGSVSIPDTASGATASYAPPASSSAVVTTTTLTCPCCRGKTFITCVNCKGDGRGVPLFLNKKVSRDPESEIEDVGYA
ncbi:unnamed protein product [Scytosiphon promiscuus]